MGRGCLKVITGLGFDKVGEWSGLMSVYFFDWLGLVELFKENEG